VLDDGARAEEADPGDDVRGHTRGVEHDPRLVAEVELGPAVVAAEHEEARADADEHVRAQTGFLLANLALDADDAGEPRR
jgi:hypothetical protein